MSCAPQACCPICLDSLSLFPIGATSPCGHIFHRECFDHWANSANNRCSSSSSKSIKCPTCNQKSKHFLNLFLDFDKLHMSCDDSESDDGDAQNERPSMEKYSLLKTKYRNFKRDNAILKDMASKYQDCVLKLKEAEENVNKSVEAESSVRSALEHALYTNEKSGRTIATLNETVKKLEKENMAYKENQKVFEQNMEELENRKLKEIKDARANRLSEVQMIIQRNSELLAKIKSLEAKNVLLERQFKEKSNHFYEHASSTGENTYSYSSAKISEVKAIVKETVTNIDRINVQAHEEEKTLKRKSDHEQMMSKLSSRASSILLTAMKKQKRTVRPTFAIAPNNPATSFTDRKSSISSSITKPNSSGGASIKRFFN